MSYQRDVICETLENIHVYTKPSVLLYSKGQTIIEKKHNVDHSHFIQCFLKGSFGYWMLDYQWAERNRHLLSE